MIYQKVPWTSIAPKVYLNGFPKSGLHFAELMVQRVVNTYTKGPMSDMPWVGTTDDRGFSLKTVPDMRLRYWIWGTLPSGYYVKGHVYYDEEVAHFLDLCGMSVIFIYRDLRDVAVSQVHQILDSGDNPYPGKEFYQGMDFDEVLMVVIRGIGRYPGLIERWDHFSGWMDCDWVLPVNFEEMKEEPQATARNMLEYFLLRMAGALGTSFQIDDVRFTEIIEEMVEGGKRTHLSPSFRKGEIGNWEEAFSDEHKTVFKEAGGGKKLMELGYAKDEDW